MSWFTRTRAAYLVVAAVLAVVGVRAAAGGDGGGGMPPVHTVAYDAAPTAPTVTEAPLVVHVVGRVRHPGVYRLPSGGRVGDAVRRAGGPRRDADLAAVNLAAPLVDGSQVLVPARGAAPAAAPGAGGTPSAAPGQPLSLATATAPQLEELDGIGPTLAARIIEWRDTHGGFRTVEELGDVPGIGDARLAALQGKVVP